MLKNMNSGILRTSLTDMMPEKSPAKVSFTLLYIDSRRSNSHINSKAAMPQMAVTHHPAVEN